jgi:bacteriochlorophyllide a dehydrogenase
MKTKAVVFTDRRKVEVLEVTAPEPAPHDVVVETRFSWISNGTEGSFLRGERINGETPYREGDPWPFPYTAGYQSTGIVMDVGTEVSGIQPGDWVFCTVGRVEGMFEPFAGHISPKVVHYSQIWPLPEGVSPEAVSGLVLVQVGYNCGTRPPVAVGDTALVIGDGMVGHWAAQTLHWRGATVIFAGKHDERLALFGGKRGRHLVNVTKEPLGDAVEELAPRGLHLLVDTVGVLQTVRDCLPFMRQDGHIVSAGFNRTDSLLDVQKLRFGEQTFYSPSGWQKKRMDEALALIAAGYLDTASLITHRFPVDEAARAWRLILDRTEPVLGVILTW